MGYISGGAHCGFSQTGIAHFDLSSARGQVIQQTGASPLFMLHILISLL